MPHTARLTPAREERLQYGKSLRQRVSRVSHAEWDPKRRDVSALELLRASERGRVANLLPIKAARMAASPFGFYRGSVPLMAFDLSKLPSTVIYAQLCGDAARSQFGSFEGLILGGFRVDSHPTKLQRPIRHGARQRSPARSRRRTTCILPTRR